MGKAPPKKTPIQKSMTEKNGAWEKHGRKKRSMGKA